MADGNKFPKAPSGTEWRVSVERSQGGGDWVRASLVDSASPTAIIASRRYRLTRVDSGESARLWAIAAAGRALEEYAGIEADKTLAEALTEEANGRPVVPS